MSNKNTKYPLFLTFLSLGLLVAILFFVVRSYQINMQLNSLQNSPTATPKITPTIPANWLLFTDSNYQFSFRYPPNWNQINKTSKYTNLITFEATDKSQIQIIIDKTQLPTLNAYLSDLDTKNQTSWEGKPNKKIIFSTIEVIGGNAAVQRKEEWLAAGFTTLATYIKEGNRIFIFNLLPGSLSYDKTQAFANYNQIISSLTFK